MRVEIGGAGMAGLAAARAFGQEGWEVRVHERASSVREIGAGIFMIQNGMRALDELGLGERLRDDGVQLSRREMMTGDGKLLQAVDISSTAAPWVFPRQHLVQSLLAGAVEVGAEVLVASPVEGADPNGAILLKGGESVDADLVIGADGYRSAIRRALGVESKRPDLGTTSLRFLIDSGDPAIPGTTRQYWAASRRMMVAPCGRKQTYVYFACRHSDPAARQEPGWLDDWIQAMPAAASILESLRQVVPHVGPYPEVQCSTWVSNRVAIVGDAAHAMAPTLGQGANLAVANSLIMARMLRGATRSDVPEILRRWETLRRPITEHTQKWSRWYNTLSARFPESLAPMRNFVVSAFGRFSALDKRMRAADFDTEYNSSGALQ